MRRHADPSAVQRTHGDFEAFALFAEHLRNGHFDILENQLHGLRGPNPHFMFLLAKSKARHSLFQDKGGNAFNTFGFVGHGKNHINFGFAAIGDENLAAVDNVVVAVTDRNGLLGGGVGAGTRFRETERAHLGSFRERNQIFLFLLFRTISKNRPGTQRNRRRQGNANPRIRLADFFHGQDVAQDIAIRTAVLLGKADSRQAEADHFIIQRTGKCFVLITFFRSGRDLLLGKITGNLLHHFLVFCQFEHFFALLSFSGG